ncbi:hypothetical protein ABWH97_13125 [Nitratireductor sp. ac15]
MTRRSETRSPPDDLDTWENEGGKIAPERPDAAFVRRVEADHASIVGKLLQGAATARKFRAGLERHKNVSWLPSLKSC